MEGWHGWLYWHLSHLIFGSQVPQPTCFWTSQSQAGTLSRIIQLQRGLRPTIFEVSLTSTSVLKKVEHKLRNEICARRQSSKLSDWRPLEFFFGAAMKKCKKTIFFIKRSFPKICSKKPISRLGPCESWRPELSENVGLIERIRFWTGVIGRQRWMSPKKWSILENNKA